MFSVCLILKLEGHFLPHIPTSPRQLISGQFRLDKGLQLKYNALVYGSLFFCTKWTWKA